MRRAVLVSATFGIFWARHGRSIMPAFARAFAKARYTHRVIMLVGTVRTTARPAFQPEDLIVDEVYALYDPISPKLPPPDSEWADVLYTRLMLVRGGRGDHNLTQIPELQFGNVLYAAQRG